jgi:fibrillarin-like pre-rRNA processing protein
VSHVSDIVGSEGRVFATEVAPRVARELLESVVKFRSNVVPIIADARRPESYPSIYGKVSSVYCDIAQQNQTEIAIANCSRYLRPEGILILVVKASSIDALTPKAKVFREQTNILERSEFEVNELLDLEPFDRNHALILARPRRR